MEHPGIFFFPFSEPTPIEISGMENGVLARRIPDFLCICLNDDGKENASLLELRAADENGEPTGDWASFPEMPPADDLMSFLPGDGDEAAVVGTLKRARRLEDPSTRGGAGAATEEIEIDMRVIRDGTGFPSTSFPWHLSLADPGASCVELARKIAKELSLPANSLTWQRLGSKNPRAFLHFLRGLDGAARLDPDVIGDRDPQQLLEPFVVALELDPDFGLALRRLHTAITEAVSECAFPLEEGLQLLDRAYASFPSDKEAAAGIGEFLAAIEELDRAEEWLRLAIQQPEPPPAALEALGILLANRGETIQARNLWLTGVRLDGDPDFFAHLARLAFTEGAADEAWDKVLRGLRRISERRLHPGEWDGEEGRGGVLLRYLSEHLEEVDAEPPGDVVELLVDLCAQIREPDDRLDLGICLFHVGKRAQAATTIRAALPHVENTERRDLGAQFLADLLVPDFDERFARAAEIEEDGDEAAAARDFLAAVHDKVPQFWPASYFRGRLLELAESWDDALEAYRTAASFRRDQSPIFARIAVCAQRLGDLDGACEAMAKACEIDPNEPGMHADYALLLHRAGRTEEARGELETAETLDPSDEAAAKVRRILAPEADAPGGSGDDPGGREA